MDDALASFAMAYADRTNSDYDKLMKAKGDLVKPAGQAGQKAGKKPAKNVGKKRVGKKKAGKKKARKKRRA
jgi:hypothetical protein